MPMERCEPCARGDHGACPGSDRCGCACAPDRTDTGIIYADVRSAYRAGYARGRVDERQDKKAGEF